MNTPFFLSKAAGLLLSKGKDTGLTAKDSTKQVTDLARQAEKTSSSLSTGVFQQWLEDQIPHVISFATLVLLALLVWFIGMKVTKFIRKLVRKALERHQIETGIRQFVDACVKVICYLALIALILRVFGIEATSLAAVVASMGVTAGLALQGALSNFAGGVLILLLKPFVVGDYIVEDTQKNEGTVAEISIFYTTLHSLDNKTIVIPNGVLANASLTNVTHAMSRLLDLEVGISYDADIRTAKDVLFNLAMKEKKRLPDSTPSVFVKELGESSVVLGLRFQTKTEDYWEVRFRMLENMKYALDEAGISIPYPQLDVHSRAE